MGKSRGTALDMIQRYKEIICQLAELTKEIRPLYEEAGKLRKYLATYKCRGVVTAEDLPYENHESIQDQIDHLVQEGESYTDEVGGHHDNGIGWNPNGVWCGECTKESCSGCVNEHLTEAIHK